MRLNKQITLAALAIAINSGQHLVIDSVGIPLRGPSPCPINTLEWVLPKQKNRSYDAPGKARRKKGKR